MNDLIIFIKDRINSIESKISNAPSVDIKLVNKINSNLNACIPLKDINNLKYIDINELRKILPIDSKNDLDSLEFYIKVLGSFYEDKLNSVKLEIENVLNHIIREVNIMSNKYSEIQNMLGEKDKLEEILHKLENNYKNINNDDIEFIYLLLNSLDDKNEAINLGISFGESLLSSTSLNAIVEDNVEILYENNNINDILDELRDLFKKYNLDFDGFYDILSDDEKDMLARYVKVKNVEEILERLKKFNISLNDSYDGTKLLYKKARQLKSVFLYSNASVVNKVLSCVDSEKIYDYSIVDENGQQKQGIDFDLILEVPGRLIDRKTRSRYRGTQLIDIIIENNDKESGYADSFIGNLHLFIALGLDYENFFKNLKISQKPTDKIKNTLNIFELYGVNKDLYLKTLSCFVSIHQSDIMDQFIEIGAFDYVLHNLSRCNLLPDDVMFYRYIYGMKYTDLPREKLISNSRKFTYYVAKEDSFGINNTNKDAKVHQRKKSQVENAINQRFDEIINPAYSDVSAALGNNIIQLLDDNYLLKDKDGNIIYPSVYHFDDIVTSYGKTIPLNISRNKVLRIANQLIIMGDDIDNIEIIMGIITRNSILTEEEYGMIRRKVEKLFIGRSRN